jgi:hypothetical protein
VSLQTIYNKLEDAIKDQTNTLTAKCKTASLDDIRYSAGILEGFKLASKAIQDSIAKGGE